jgi:hypothetical protein
LESNKDKTTVLEEITSLKASKEEASRAEELIFLPMYLLNILSHIFAPIETTSKKMAQAENLFFRIGYSING